MKYKIIYIISLVILGILVGFALVRPAATSDQYSEVSREHLLKTEEGYIVAFDILNHEGAETRYTIMVTLDNRQSSEDIVIKDGKIFTYVHNIYPEKLADGEVNVSISKTGQSTPFEKLDYYVK